jgi:hypothetical protein
VSYPNPYPDEFGPPDESTQEYLDRIEREHPWGGPSFPPTGSLAEKLAEEARWGDDDREPEEDDDGDEEGA